jgi:hypothetical protein
MNDPGPSLTAWQWWAAHRGRYNIGLIASGIIAFICYATLVWTFSDRMPETKITIFTTLVQAFGYLIMIGVANLFYFLGPIAERIIKPSDPSRFRLLAYQMGFWGSVSLPILIPILLLILIVTKN